MGAKLAPTSDRLHIDSSIMAPIYRGKVRDTYDLENGLLLIVATDRLSIFDFVLGAEVPLKGEVLTAFNIFWRKHPSKLIPQHRGDLVACGRDIIEYLPAKLQLSPDVMDLCKRAVVVRKLDMLPYEFIVRGCLTGSGYDDYQKTGTVYGNIVPAGLKNGSILDPAAYTPTDKAEDGHDMPVDPAEISRVYGSEPQALALSLFDRARSLAEKRGIILPDTKFEFGRDSDGNLCVGDEVLSPDSSRYWSKEDWELALKEDRVPKPFDKQYVRDYGKENGVHKLDPEKPLDVRTVHELVIPEEHIEETTRVYLNIFEMMTGQTLQEFQSEVLAA